MFNYKDTVTEKKGKVKVVLFGPYKNGGYERLDVLKKELLKRGYLNTELVANLPIPSTITKTGNPEVDDTIKSEYWIEHSHINLFAFYKDIPYGSVTIEMKHMLDQFPEKVNCSSFFVQIGTSLQTLEKGTMRKHRLDISHFETDDDLYAMAEKACFHHLIEGNCLS